MPEQLVTGVRLSPAPDGTHSHILEVFTQGAIHYTLAEALAEIAAGANWRVIGHTDAELRIIERCPHPGCELAPYLSAGPDGAGTLESLSI